MPHRRRVVSLAIGAAFAAAGSSALANPTDGTVVSGSATFATSGNTLSITNTPGAIINWQQFSIQKDEITRFIQQNGMSAVLNRVTTQNPSVILGTLRSELSNGAIGGRVFLINPSGIAFGVGSVINVGGLAASTLNISDSDFLAGRFRFAGTGTEGALTNAGKITTSEGGHVYLIAPKVENQAGGVITSPKGEVVIAAGKTVELVNAQTPDIRVQYTAPANEAVNAGEIVAASGRVGVYGTLIKNSGHVSASAATLGEGGKIVFKAVQDVTLDATSRLEANGAKGGAITVQSDTGTLLAQGVVEAKGSEQAGGEIQMLGAQVGLVGTAKLDASGAKGGGTVLVGGDFQGKNADVQNAQRTYVGSGVSINADATDQGDGGKVVVWADGDTRYYGNISARGGANGGNGGNAEVSGEQYLDFRGRVDLRAPKGRTGDLLLDPFDITVVHDATDLSGAIPELTETPGSPFEFLSNALAILNDGTINAQLVFSNVRVKTGSGSITFDTSTTGPANGAIDIHSLGLRNLTFDADDNIAFVGGQSTSINLHGGQLTLRAQGGTIDQTAGSTLDLSNPTGTPLLLIAGAGIGTTGPFVTTGVSDLAATVTTSTSGGIAVQNSGSDVTITSLTAGIGNLIGGVTSASGLRTQGGDISLQNQTGVAVNDSVTTGGGAVSITSSAGAVISSGSGDITTTPAANSGLVSGSVTIGAATGVILAGEIDTDGADKAGGDASAGGAVSITTTNGSIALANIDTHGGDATGLTGNGGAGGSLTTTAVGGSVTLGSVRTDGGTPGSTSGAQGMGGAVTISGETGVAVNDSINTGGGAVSLTSSAGAVTSSGLGDITTTPAANSGLASGPVTIGAATGVTLAGEIDTDGADKAGGSASAGGVVSITTTNGSITLASVDTHGGDATGLTGNGGAGGSLTTTAVGGSVTLSGSVRTDGGTPGSTSGAQGMGGAVTISGETGVAVNDSINTGGGAVSITSSAGAVTSNGLGEITTTPAASSGLASGSVTIGAATGVILLGDIDTDGADKAGGDASAGGAVSITTTNGSIALANIDTHGGDATGGNGGAGGAVTITGSSGSSTVTLGAVNTVAGSGGTPGADGTVQITAADVDLPGSINSGSADVTFLTSTPGATIGVGDSGAGFNLSDGDLGNVSTTGTIRIGSIATNTGGISIGATQALTQGARKFAFATAGNIAVGGNDFTTLGTVSLTAGGGAITTGAGVIAASTLTATANAGIALNTNVTTLSLANTSGDVAVSDADSVSVSGTNSGGGAFNVTAGGLGSTLTVNSTNINANAGSVILRGDILDLTGTVTGNAGVTLRPNTVLATIGVEDGGRAFNVTNTMLGQITTAGTVTVGAADHTGDISAAGDNAISTTKSLALVTDGSINLVGPTVNGISAGALALTAGANGNIATAAITQAATNIGRLATTTGNLTLSAANGIGTLVNPVQIGAVAGSLSATNTNSGAIALDIATDTLNVGGAGGINQFAGGSIRLDQTASAPGLGTMTITGNITAGPGGTIILNPDGVLVDGAAGVTAAGTVTAGTVQLGTNGNATQIGAAGDAIATAATTLLDARSTGGTGGVFLTNTGNVNVTAQVTGGSGAIDIANSGTLATTGAGITSVGGGVSVASTGDITIGHDVTAGNAGTISLAVSGAEGTLTHSLGAIDGNNQLITLRADKMDLAGGTIGSAAGDTVLLRSQTAGNAIDLGSPTNAAASTLELSSAELGTVQAGTLRIGDSGAGAITISADVTLGAAAVHLITGSAVTGTTGGLLGNKNLAIEANGTVDITDASTDVNTLAVSNAGNNVTFSNSTDLTIGSVDNIDGVSGSIVSLTSAGAGGLTVANTAATQDVNASGALTLRADALTLTGTVTGSSVTLRPNDTTATIGVEDLTQSFNVTNAMLGQITTAGTVTVGATAHTGDISAAGDAAISTTKSLALVTDGSINLVGPTANGISAGALTLIAGAGGNTLTAAITQAATNTGRLATTTGDLTLSAANGIGSLAAPLQIGAVAGSASATNTNSGAIALDIATDTLNVGGGGGINQFAGGSIRLDQTASAPGAGTMTITGDISAGTGAIILNADGVLARTAGTLTADTIDLGTAGTTTRIGTAAAPIWLRSNAGAASPSVTAQLTTSGTEIALLQTAGPLTTSSYTLITDAASTQNVSLSTTNANLTSDGFGVSTAGTGNDNLALTAGGAGKTMSITASLITTGNVSLTADAVTSTVGGAITTTAAADSGIASGAVSITAVSGVNLVGSIDTHGAANATGNGSAGGAVTVTTTDGSIMVAGIDARGGNSTGGNGGAGGAVQIRAGDPGASIYTTILNGAIRADAGTGGTPTAGGAIRVNDVAGTGTGLTSVAAAVSTTNADIDIRGTGVTVQGTGSISTTGTGLVSVNAGIGTLTNAGSITNSGAATAITLTADNMALAGGTIAGGSGVVTLQQSSNGQLIDLGGVDAGGTLGLTDGELDAVSTTGVLRIGNASSGAMTISAAIDTLGVSTTRLTSGTSIGGAGTFTEGSLALVAGSGGINVNTAASSLAASATGGGVTISNTTAGTLTVTTVDGTVTGISSGATPISLTETAGHVTLAQAVNAGASTVAITLNGDDKLLTNNTTVTGTGGVTLTADKMALAGGTVNAGTASAILRSKNAGDAINLGSTTDAAANTLELSSAELDTITAGTLLVGDAAQTGAISVTAALAPANATDLTLLNRTGGIDIQADVGATGNLTLTANGGGALTGAITRSTGAGTLAAGTDLTLSAATGIGDTAGAKPIVVGTVGGSLSATNTTSGDLYLQTGTVTLGVAGTSLQQQASGGELRVDSSGSVTIGGDLTAGVSNNGTVTLNAAGTITRPSTGTLFAQTVNLGTASATAVGASGAAIVTSTANLNAASSAGDIWLANDASVSLTANAVGGLVNVQNTGLNKTLTVAAGGVSSSSSSVTLTTTGAMTVNGNVTAANTAVLTSVGLTNAATISAAAGFAIDAGTGTLDNTGGTITNGGGIGTSGLTADNMALAGGTITVGSARLYVRQSTNGQLINLGGADAAGTLGLTDTELDTISTTGVLQVGDALSGAMTISAPIDTLGVSTTQLASGVRISGPGTFTEGSLALVVGSGGISVNTSVANLAAGATGGGVTISNTTAGTLNVTTVDGISGIFSNGTPISLTETTGHVTLAQAVNAGASTVSITLNGDDKLLTNSTTVTGTGGVALKADKMALAGGTVNAGSAIATLKTGSGTDAIAVGAAGDTTANTLEISNAELTTITATSIVIGDAAAQSGDVTLGRDHAVTQGTKNLQFLTSGDVTVAGFDLTGNTVTVGNTALSPVVDQIKRSGAGSLNATTDLNLYAINGIGSTAGNGILVGTVGGSLSATNTTSGDLYLQTGTVTLGVAGTSLQQQASGGELRVDSSGSITIGGDLTAGVSNNGTVTLNAAGTITRPSTGTLFAQTVNLGTTSATAVGAGGAAIVTSTANLNAASSAGDIWLANDANASLTASAVGGLVDVQNTGTNKTLTVVGGGVSSDVSSITLSTTGLLAINAALSTKGGAVNVTSTSGSVTSSASGTITTTPLAVAAITSGAVTISGNTGVNLAGNIDTRGANNNPGNGFGAGAVTIITVDGPVAVAGADARGGNSTGGNGGAGGAITIRAGDAAGGTSNQTTTLNGALRADAGTGGTPSLGGTILVNDVAGTGTGLTTVAAAVSTSSADIHVRGTGVTIQGTGSLTIATAGLVLVDAGTGTLTNAGTISNSGTTFSVALVGDNMALGGGTITAGSGGVSVQQSTNGQLINLGSADAAGTLGLTDAELDTISTSGVLRIGNASSGAMSISAPIDTLGVSTTHLASGSSITKAGAFTITEASLALTSGSGGINVNTSAGSLAANSAGGGVTISNTIASTLDVTTVDGIVGISSSGTAISLAETTGHVTLAQAVNAGASTAAITLNGDDKLLTNNSAITGTGGVSLTADKMALAGGTVNAGTASATLKTGSGTDAIAVGATGDATANTLELSNAELTTITATSIVIGDAAAQSGDITLGRDHVVTQGTKNLQFLSSGDVTVAGFDLTGNTVTVGNTALSPVVDQIKRSGAGALNATTDLNLYAINGIGSTAGNGVLVGTVGGNLAATNTTSGDLYLQTGTVTLGVAGISLQQQASGGELRVDSSGSVTIGGDLSAGQSNDGIITLNAAGTITRPSTGTLFAQSVNLGRTSATAVGASGAAIVTSTANLNAKSSAGLIEIANSGDLNAQAQATGGTVNIQETGNFTSSGALTSSSAGVTVAATGSMSIGHDVGAAGTGQVNLSAGSGAVANQDFTQTAGLISSNTGAIAIAATRNVVSTRATQSNAITSAGGAISLTSDSDTLGGGAIALTDAIVNSGGGAISLGGAGGAAAVGAGALIAGVDLQGAQLLSGGGAIVVRGQGAAVDGGVGVKLMKSGAANALISSGAGAITIQGTGGNSAGSSTTNNHGIWMSGAGTVGDARIVSTGGDIGITGTRGNTNGVNNIGVLIEGAAEVQSAAGNITIAGGGSAGFGTNLNAGVVLQTNSSAVRTTGTGNISITGTGGGNGNSNSGVRVTATALVETTGAGDVTINGTGGAGGGGANDGVIVDNSGLVRATGTGSIALTGAGGGTGAASFGVRIDSSVTTASGTIAMDGNNAASAAGVLVNTGATVGGATSGDILLLSRSGKGMSLAGTVQSAGNVTLNAVGGGTVSQTGGSITANGVSKGLRLLSDASSTFTLNQSNDAAVLVGSLAGTSTLSYTDANGFAITTLTSFDGTASTTTNGLTVGTSAGAGNQITLVAAGAVTQGGTNQSIVTNALRLSGTGSYVLQNPSNDVATLAANPSGGAFKYTDASGFQIGTVNGVSGISVGANDVTLGAAGAVTQATSSDNIAAAGLELLGAGPYTLTNAGNNVVTIAGLVTNAVQYTDSNALTVGSVNTAGLSASDIVLSAGGQLTLADNLAATSADVRLVTTADVNQTGGAVTANNLGVRAATGVALAQSGNNASTVAMLNSTSGSVSYRDSDGFAIDTVGSSGAFTSVSGISNATRDVTLNAGGAVTQTQAISAGGLELLGTGPYTLTNGSNDVGTIAANTGGAISYTDANSLVVGTVNATPGVTTTGNLTLNAGGAVTQTQAIAAAGLELLGTGPYTLTNGSNDVGTIAANTGGTISYTDANNLTVGTVNAISGISTTGNGAVTLNAGGVLTLASAVGTITADGAVSLTGTGGISTAANVTTTDDDISFNSATTLTGSVVLSTGAAGGGSISFGSTLTGTTTGTESLTLTAGTGDVTFTGAVGGTRLGAVQISSATNVTANAITAASLVQSTGGGLTALNGLVDTNTATGVAVTTNDITVGGGITTTVNGTVTLTNAGTLNLNGDISADGAVAQNGAGAVAVGGAGTRSIQTTTDDVTFTSAVTLNRPLSIDTGGGAISFGSTLSGTQDVTLAAGAGNITVAGDVGATRLGALTITSGNTVQFQGTGTQQAASLSVTASTSTTFTGKLDLSGGATLASGAGDVSFLNALNTGAASSFANTGTLQIGDNVADTSSINGALTHTAGATTLGGSLTTSTVQLAATSLTADTTLNATGTVDFTSTLVGPAALTVTTPGLTTFSGTVGVGTALASLTTDGTGTTAINGGVVTTSGAQTYSDAVTLGANTTFNGVGVNFASTLNSSGTNRVLTVNDSGTTVFGGPVGGTLALTSITTDAAGTTDLNAATITTTGAQTYNDAVVLTTNVTLNGAGLTFASTVQSPATAFGLTLNDSGTTTFSGAVGGGGNPLLSVTTNAGGATAINGGAVTTTGAQTYGDAVTLGANTTFGGAGITFASTLNSAGSSRTVTVNDSGTTTFGGIVGGTAALASLTTNTGGTTAINGGAVTTTGTQTYNDAVTLGADTTIDGVGVTFGSTLNSSGTNRALTVNDSGTTTFGGAVGGTFLLSSLTTDAPGTTAINGGAVRTTFAQTYNDAVTVGTTAATLLSSGGWAITFNSTVDGPQALTVNTSGATIFGAAVGGTTALTSLMTDATGSTAINGGAVTTTGAQSYGDDVTLNFAGNTSLSGAGISFAGSLAGGTTPKHDLTVAAGSGDFSVAGALTGVVNLTVASAQNVSLTNAGNGNTITGTATFTAGGNVDYTDTGSITLGTSTIGGAAVIESKTGGITTGTGLFAANGGITLVANDTSAQLNNGTITVGSGGLSSTNAPIRLHAADDITVNGPIYSHRGNIEFIAGKGSDVPISNGIDTSAVSRPADETADNFGALTFNARVDTRVDPLLPVGTTPVTAADGEIMVVTAAVNSSPLLKQNNVTQGVSGDVVSKQLTVVTLKGTGGLGVAGADILLDNPSTPLTPINTNSAVRLFACASDGCPTTISGTPVRVSGSTTQYAGGTIRYTDTSGVNLTGLGTVSDFSSFTSGTLTLSASTFSAGNVTLGAGVDIIIDLASDLLETSSIASNTLTLNAGRDILYVNSSYSGAGHTLGAPGNPFKNNLNLTGGRHVVLNNSLYLAQGLNINATGDVAMLGNYVAQMPGTLSVQGSNFSLLGYGNVILSAGSLDLVGTLAQAPTGTNAAGQELTAGTINLMNSGVIAVEAGTATVGQASGAHMKATTINIGSSGSPNNPTQLRIAGGLNNNLGLSTTNPADPNFSTNQADAVVEATGTLTAFLSSSPSVPLTSPHWYGSSPNPADYALTAADPFGKSYSLIIRGGQAQATDAGQGFRFVTALGELKAHDLQLTADGSVLIQGGSSIVGPGAGQALSGAPGAPFVASSALVTVDSSKNFNTLNGGSVIIRGGTTNVSPSSLVDGRNAVSMGQLDPSTLTMNVAGVILLEAGRTLGTTGSLASARIDSGDLIVINVNGAATNYTYNNTQSGPKTLNGNFFMIGSSSSGLFDRNNQPVPGTSSPVTINVPVLYDYDGGLGASVVQTGRTTFNNALLAYIIFAANEETRSARFRRLLGDSDDLGAPTCK